MDSGNQALFLFDQGITQVLHPRLITNPGPVIESRRLSPRVA